MGARMILQIFAEISGILLEMSPAAPILEVADHLQWLRGRKGVPRFRDITHHDSIAATCGLEVHDRPWPPHLIATINFANIHY
jgi:hypothetical protein